MTRSPRALGTAGPLLLLALVGTAIWPPAPRPSEVVRTYTRAPSAIERDSLAAHAANGTVVRWSGSIAPVAVEVDADPVRGAARIAVANPEAWFVRVSDRVGSLDSGSAGTMRVRGAMEELEIAVGNERLTTRLSGVTKGIVVLGAAGWETKFLIQMLEGLRVPVDGRVRVGPQTFVTQGRPLPLDSARHSTVIVLGALEAAAANQVRRFVREGGGLVLANGEWGLGDLAPGRFGRAVRPPAALSLPSSRTDLVVRPIGNLFPRAAALTDAPVRTAVRRVGGGRVVQLAEEDTWRLAMASETGRASHADLWLGALAAARSRELMRPQLMDQVAPRASTVEALGAPSDTSDRIPDVPWRAIFAMAALAMLLADWAARRTSGMA